MARKISVVIVGNTSGIEHSFRRAAAAGGVFGHSLTGLATRVAGLVGGLYTLEKASSAAWSDFSKGQQVSAQTAAALKSTGGIANVTGGHIQALAKEIENLSGVQDHVVKSGENVLLAFTNIRNGVGKDQQLFDRTTRAMADLAARTGKDMPAAAAILGKALNDPAKGLARLRTVGIVFTADQKKQIEALQKTGHVQEAQVLILKKFEDRYKGAAAAGAGVTTQLRKIRNAFQDIGGAVISNLLGGSGATGGLRKLVKYLQDAGNQQRIVKKVADALRQLASAARAVASVAQSLIPLANGVKNALGGWKNVVKLLIALKVASWMRGVQGGIIGVGNQAKVARGKVGGLRGALLGINGLQVVATILVVQKLVQDFTGSSVTGHSKLSDFAHDINPKTGKQGALGQLVGGIVKYGSLGLTRFRSGGQGGLPVQPPLPFQDAASAVFGGKKAKTFGQQPGVHYFKPKPFEVSPIPDPTGGGGGGGGGGAGSITDLPDWLAYRKALAEGTKTIIDDLKVDKQIVAYFKQKLAGTKAKQDRADLIGAINQYRSEQTDLEQQLADLRKTTEMGKAFRLLGLGPTGEALIPGRKSLLKRLGTLSEAVKGTTLDTKAQERILANVGKVLRSHAGQYAEMRDKIAGILDDLKQKLKDHAGDVTKFAHANTAHLLAGLGLSPDEVRAVRSRLAQLGPGGTIPHGSTAFAGAGGGGYTIGELHLHGIQNTRQFEEEMNRRMRSRPAIRRGAR